MVYLVTAPRFLGYSFNPVSFWYLYSEEKELKAMILEVNNTFDERRVYFLKQDGNSSSALPNDNVIDSADLEKFPMEIQSIQTVAQYNDDGKFRDTWIKDFHVSPFNSRKGSYSLSAFDPFFPRMIGSGAINNTITLRSSQGYIKLIARIFSTNAAIDPSILTVLERLRFVWLWWWVGLVTFPRIIREAGKLFFIKRLHVWFRPEVLKGSIGRRETRDER